MKVKIIILSDLWGKHQSDWVNHYYDHFHENHELIFYDSCKLGKIDISTLDEKSIHQQFIQGGIDRAVSSLIQLEPGPVSLIGCSIGGLIAWRAGLLGLDIQNLITISSTRLRLEHKRPNCPIHSYFGELDLYKPTDAWFQKMKLKQHIIPNAGHELYKDKSQLAFLLKAFDI